MSGIRRSCRLRNKHQLIQIGPRAGTETYYGRFDVHLHSCKYKYRGCKEKRDEEAVKVHKSECRFRWYKCEGRKFGGWSCKWKGYREDIMHHFKKVHPERTYMKSVSAKNHTVFWFKHRLISEEKIAYWLCQHIGLQEEASTYCYELVTSDEGRKFAVTELCYTGARFADEIYESGKFVVMTLDQISFMSKEKNIQVYFRIKKQVKGKR